VQQRQRQVIRGLGAATVATTVAATSHGIADGAQPSVAGLILAIVFAAAVCIPLARTRMPLPRLTAAVTISQLGFHLVFSYLGASGTAVATSHHGGVEFAAGAPAQHSTPLMWILHTCAAIATIAALRHGERVLTAIGRTLLRTTSFAMPLVPALPRRAAARRARRSATLVLLDSRGLRGPPLHILVGAQ
jgi:hypothetical protein